MTNCEACGQGPAVWYPPGAPVFEEDLFSRRPGRKIIERNPDAAYLCRACQNRARNGRIVMTMGGQVFVIEGM
jgi:hypothetical protein